MMRLRFFRRLAEDNLGFRFSLAELSGALADLGVLLPLTLALVTLNGMNAASAFVVIGFAYLVNAFAYRLPIPVQPLKSLAATALALGLSPSVVISGAWWMAVIFLVLAVTNAAQLIQCLFSKP
ncbi:MAG TPA: putative sulfate/molybdate transporter, partial [Anaerolineales bacterium]